MKFDLFGLIDFEIDWKAIAFISFTPVVIKLIDNLF